MFVVLTKVTFMKILRLSIRFFIGFFIGFNAPVMAQEAQQVDRYVLVHGASGGAWDWKTVETILTQRGHDVHRVTLAGLGEKVHLANPDINLTTHIHDVANVIIFEQLDDVVLVGHSYGGMVITGVMNKIPTKIKHAIFLDAAIPNHGMSAFDLWPRMQDYKLEAGMVMFPWLIDGSAPPHDVPQSLKTLTEPVAFDNPAAQKLPATYIPFIDNAAIGLARAASDPSWKHARARGWPIHKLVSDHNAQRSHPIELVDMMEQAVQASAD